MESIFPFKNVKAHIMEAVDEKVSETITVRKGTMWAIGIVPAILIVLFSYGASAIGWARDDQSTKSDVRQLRIEVDKLNSNIGDIQMMKASVQALQVDISTIKLDQKAFIKDFNDYQVKRGIKDLAPQP